LIIEIDRSGRQPLIHLNGLSFKPLSKLGEYSLFFPQSLICKHLK
jgi:hypothetical protein